MDKSLNASVDRSHIPEFRQSKDSFLKKFIDTTKELLNDQAERKIFTLLNVFWICNMQLWIGTALGSTS